MRNLMLMQKNGKIRMVTIHQIPEGEFKNIVNKEELPQDILDDLNFDYVEYMREHTPEMPFNKWNTHSYDDNFVCDPDYITRDEFIFMTLADRDQIKYLLYDSDLIKEIVLRSPFLIYYVPSSLKVYNDYFCREIVAKNPFAIMGIKNIQIRNSIVHSRWADLLEDYLYHCNGGTQGTLSRSELNNYSKVRSYENLKDAIKTNLGEKLPRSIITRELIMKVSEFEDYELIKFLNKVRHDERDKITFLEMINRVSEVKNEIVLSPVQRIDDKKVTDKHRLACYNRLGVVCFNNSRTSSSTDPVSSRLNELSNKDILESLNEYFLEYLILDNLSDKKLVSICNDLINKVKGSTSILTKKGQRYAFKELVTRELMDDYKQMCNTVGRPFLTEFDFFCTINKTDFGNKNDITLYGLASCTSVHECYTNKCIKNSKRYCEILEELFPNFK